MAIITLPDELIPKITLVVATENSIDIVVFPTERAPDIVVVAAVTARRPSLVMLLALKVRAANAMCAGREKERTRRMNLKIKCMAVGFLFTIKFYHRISPPQEQGCA